MNEEERVVAAGSKRAPQRYLSAYAPELPRFASSLPADAPTSQAGGIRTALLAPKAPRRGEKNSPEMILQDPKARSCWAGSPGACMLQILGHGEGGGNEGRVGRSSSFFL